MPIRNRLLQRFTDGVSDLLFPPHCLGCDDILPPLSDGNAVLCPICHARWESARAEAAAPAAQTALHGHTFAVLYHSGHTDGVPERVIYHLKHTGSPRAFAFVAAALSPRVRSLLMTATSSLSVHSTATASPAAPTATPVSLAPSGLLPLFTYPPRRRKAVRRDGFDQAALLAKALAKSCGGDFAPLLSRTHRPSAEQKRLDSAARQTNAAASYALRTSAVTRLQNRTVILCDDLSTTGSTLSSCTDLLLNAGAACVLWVTIAQTAAHSTGQPDQSTIDFSRSAPADQPNQSIPK